MVTFRNANELHDWLRSQPAAVAKAVAVRAALMAVPQLVASRNSIEFEIASLMLFKNLAIAWIANSGYRRNEAAKAAVSAAEIAADYSPAVAFAAYAAFAAASPDDTSDAADAAADVIGMVAHASSKGNSGAIGGGAIGDGPIGDEGIGASAFDNLTILDILSQWRFAIEGDVSSEFMGATAVRPIQFSQWIELKAELTRREKNWSVWIDWYEDRLIGAPPKRVFENALLSISAKEWTLPPREVNILLADRMTIGSRAAVSNFGIENGRIVGSAFHVPLEGAESVATAHLDELKAQLLKAQARLKALEGPPTFEDILDDVGRALAVLGMDLSGVQAGRLLVLLEKFRVASERITLLNDSGQFNSPADLPLLMQNLFDLLKQFMGFYGPDLKLIDDRAAALDIRPKDYEANERSLNAIVDAARQSAVVDASAIDALLAGFEDKHNIAIAIKDIPDQLDELRIKLQSQLLQEQAREIRNHQNFVEVVILEAEHENSFKPRAASAFEKLGKSFGTGFTGGVEDGVKKIISGAIVTGCSALVASLAGPVAGFALFASSVFGPLSARIRKITDNE